MTAAELERLAQELGLDVVGAAPASAYEETERHIRERKARGLFADMRFTMAQPEVSCHPETLLPGARTVLSAAHCYYLPEPPLEPGEGRLPRYTWYDGYAVLRALKGRSGGGLGLFGGQPENVTVIIVPADNILNAAKQVPPVPEEKESSKSQAPGSRETPNSKSPIPKNSQPPNPK